MRRLLRWIFLGGKMQAPEKSDTLTVKDSMALLMLKDFIMQGFPKPDMKTQVDLAYGYAELCMIRRQPQGFSALIVGTVTDGPTCASCGSPMVPNPLPEMSSCFRCPNCGESSGSS